MSTSKRKYKTVRLTCPACRSIGAHSSKSFNLVCPRCSTEWDPNQTLAQIRARARASMEKRSLVINETSYKRERTRIWESMNGCDCDYQLPRNDRCSARAIRCNGRLGVVSERLTDLEKVRAMFEKEKPT
jgi:hypothetical protein